MDILYRVPLIWTSDQLLRPDRHSNCWGYWFMVSWSDQWLNKKISNLVRYILNKSCKSNTPTKRHELPTKLDGFDSLQSFLGINSLPMRILLHCAQVHATADQHPVFPGSFQWNWAVWLGCGLHFFLRRFNCRGGLPDRSEQQGPWFMIFQTKRRSIPVFITQPQKQATLSWQVRCYYLLLARISRKEDTWTRTRT